MGTPEESGRLAAARQEQEMVRLDTVRALGLPESSHGSDVLQTICVALASIMKVSMALVTCTGREYVHFLAKHGTPDEGVDRRYSLSSYIAPTERLQMIVVEDIWNDARFEAMPWVKENKSRFYASAPLLASNGQCSGLLTIIDPKPSKRPAEDYNFLCSFAELAARELECNCNSTCYTRLEDLLQGGMTMLREPEDLEEPVILCEVTSRWWSICFANKNARKLSPLLQTPEPHFWGVFQPLCGAKNLAQKLAYTEIEQGNSFTLQVKLRERSKTEKEAMTIRFRSALGSPLSTPGATVGIPNEVNTADQLGRSVVHTHYFAVIVRPGSQRTAQRLLGSAQTFLGREFRTSNGSGRLQSDTTKGMSNVKLGIICSSSPSARIFRAVWNKQPVSVKVIAKPLSKCVYSREYQNAMMPKEAALSAELVHPNVVRTYKIVVQPKIAEFNAADYKKGNEIVEAFIVREWCGSGDLQAITQRGWLFTEQHIPNEELILSIATGIAAGLEYLHSHNIIHGGLQPSSILMAEDPHPHKRMYIAKIASLAKAEVSAKPVFVPNAPATQVYAAPELVTKGVMAKSGDVYAFGKLLCHMHGNGVILPPTLQARSWWKAKKDAVDLPEGMPSSMQVLVRACLSTRPGARPSFAEIKEKLISIAAQDLEPPPSRTPAPARVPSTSATKAKSAPESLSGRKPDLRNQASQRESSQKKQDQDYSGLLNSNSSKGREAAEQKGASAYIRSTSALFHKKVKSLARLPSRRAIAQ